MLLGCTTSLLICIIEKSIGLLPKKSKENITIFVKNIPEANGQTVRSFLRFKNSHHVYQQIHELETIMSEIQKALKSSQSFESLERFCERQCQIASNRASREVLAQELSGK